MKLVITTIWPVNMKSEVSSDMQSSFAPVIHAGPTLMQFDGVKSHKFFWSELSFRGLLEVRRLENDVKTVYCSKIFVILFC